MPWMGLGTIEEENNSCAQKGISLNLQNAQFFAESKELFDSQITNLQRFLSDNGQDWEDYAPYAMGVFVDIFKHEPGPFHENMWGIRYEVDSGGVLKTDQNGNLIPLQSQDFSKQGAVRVLGIAPFDISVFPQD